MRVIRLNGALGKRFGRVHRFDVSSPAEALRALNANFPDFRVALIESSKSGVGYRFTVDGVDVDGRALEDPMSKSVSITPVVTGSGPIAAAVAAIATWAATTVVGYIVVNAAMALAVMGVASLLAPTPPSGKAAKDRVESDAFNGAAQTDAQGGPVAVGYGELIVGSTVVSAAITVEDKPLPDAPENVPIGGMWGNLAQGLMS